MANYKPIVIDVKEKSTPQGVEQEWVDVTTHMPILTRDIKTPALDKNSDLTSVVSGMPTVFARANLFKLAIDYVDASDKDKTDADGLLNFYTNLVDEWRGFIACIALDYTRISVRRIRLAYSDGMTFAHTINIYEPKGAFGNVLFERRALWTEQGSDVSADQAPFIDVISYDGKVVGAISPESLLFTSPCYQVEVDLPFVNKNKGGKFTDPLKNTLSQDQALTLYAYVEYIEDRINNLADYYKNLSEDIRPKYSTVQNNIRSWKDELFDYCKERNYDVEAKSIPPVQNFEQPYSLLFNYSSQLYGLEGIIYDDEIHGPDHKILFDPKNILLPKKSQIARIDFSNSEIVRNPQLLEEQPVYVLKANIKGRINEYAYFALPLTPLGLNIFGKNIGALTGIDSNNAISSSLSAEFDPDCSSNNLEVTLEIRTKLNKRRELKESYTVRKDRVSNKDILLWPNFISTKWNRYFLYSEMPHNTESRQCPFRATPIVGTYKDGDFRILVDESTEEKVPILLAQNGSISIPEKTKREEGLEAKLHIFSDNRVSDNDYKYEIYESNLPFKGVKLSSGNTDSGYLVIRYTTSADAPFIPKNELGIPHPLREATVGIDFGSTNTSVAYSVGGDLKGIYFKNHRISLLQAGIGATCRERDLFFFQAKEIEGNAIKSILTLHDERRLVKKSVTPKECEVSGGMPCFNPSLLPVENVTQTRISLKCFEIGNVQLVHNMKWTTQEEDVANKKAFLRSLMLHIYAELFTQGCIPSDLKWSYPSAMGDMLVNQYSQIWNNLGVNLCPVVDEQTGTAYPLKVCASDIVASLNFDTAKGWETSSAETQDALGAWNDQNTNAMWGTSNAESVWGNTSMDNGGWGNATAANKGWDDTPMEQTGSWHEEAKPKKKVEDLETDDNHIEFHFKKIDSTKCMTEAAAVANFNSTRTDFVHDKRTLTLCFDVGGSTTDISASINIPQPDLVNTLVKQNSIRFAAQQVSAAARYEKNLQKVLLDICNQCDISIPGLNIGPDRYTPDTASFYFEQVLDRLPTDILKDFYQKLNAECHQLMCVNLYVTGLIVFYAGQLTHKLVKVIRNSLTGIDPNYANFTPVVNVMFAGKGSRIFEWFSTSQYNAAVGYYKQLFISGIGGMDDAKKFLYGPPQIQLSAQISPEVKYEVSKGLALDAIKGIQVPGASTEAIEILGEENFEIIKASTGETVPLEFDNAITSKMMYQLNGNFVEQIPNGNMKFTCKRFSDFALIFSQAASHLFELKLSKDDFIQGFANMKISSYIMNLPEYRQAMSEQKFDFVAPIIIIEGMKFYKETLLEKL